MNMHNVQFHAAKLSNDWPINEPDNEFQDSPLLELKACHRNFLIRVSDLTLPKILTALTD